MVLITFSSKQRIYKTVKLVCTGNPDVVYTYINKHLKKIHFGRNPRSVVIVDWCFFAYRPSGAYPIRFVLVLSVQYDYLPTEDAGFKPQGQCSLVWHSTVWTLYCTMYIVQLILYMFITVNLFHPFNWVSLLSYMMTGGCVASFPGMNGL